MTRGIAQGRVERSVPLLGALSVVLVVAALIVAGDTPSHHALGPEIRDAYDSEPKHQVAAFVGAVAAVPLLFFGGYWRALLKRLHASGLSADVALAGAVVAASGLVLAAVVHAALAEAAHTPELSDPALQALNALDGWTVYPLVIGLSAFVLASGVALVRTERVLAPLLGRAAVVLGVLGLIPIVGLFTAALSGAWLLILSVLLFVRTEAVDRLCEPAAPVADERGGVSAGV